MMFMRGSELALTFDFKALRYFVQEAFASLIINFWLHEMVMPKYFMVSVILIPSISSSI